VFAIGAKVTMVSVFAGKMSDVFRCGRRCRPRRSRRVSLSRSEKENVAVGFSPRSRGELAVA
jgi:hypothetical protein